jgi:hypothetical protein
MERFGTAWTRGALARPVLTLQDLAGSRGDPWSSGHVEHPERFAPIAESCERLRGEVSVTLLDGGIDNAWAGTALVGDPRIFALECVRGRLRADRLTSDSCQLSEAGSFGRSDLALLSNLAERDSAAALARFQ